MAQNSALLRPVYSDLNRQMLNSEPLPFMRFFVVTLRGKGVIFQKLRYFAIAFGVFIVSMQLMSLVELDSSKLYRIPIACDYFYVTVALISQTLIIDIQKSLKIKKKLCWSLDSAGPKIKEQIFKLGRKRDIMAALTILMSLSYEKHMINFNNIRKFDYTSAILRQHLPSLELVYSYVLIFWLILSTPMLLGWPLTYLYFGWHQQYQVLILEEFLKEISTDFRNYTVIGSLPNDTFYQDIIWDRLKFVIKRHAQILRTNHEFIKYLNISVTSMLLLISGMSLAIGSFWIVALDEEWFAPLMLFICFTLFLEILASSTQDYEDGIFEKLYAVANIMYHFYY